MFTPEGPQQGPKGVYVQIELLKQGKVSGLCETFAVHEDNLTKNDKQMNRCRKAVVEPVKLL